MDSHKEEFTMSGCLPIVKIKNEQTECNNNTGNIFKVRSDTEELKLVNYSSDLFKDDEVYIQVNDETHQILLRFGSSASARATTCSEVNLS